MLTHLLALPALFTLAIVAPGCDKPQPGDGDSHDDGADAPADADADDRDDTKPNPEAPAVDVSHVGDACDQSVLSAPCRAGGVAGTEFCVWSLDEYTYHWSECLLETCATLGEQRACETGVQYCASFDASADSVEQRWGECGEPSTCKPGDTRSCFGEDSELGYDITQGCTTDENGRHVWSQDDCNTPLVLSFDGALEFTPASTAAAAFDIHGGAGTCARADWPTARTPWLALDRDHNGAIDGGQELFGSATRMLAGAAPHNGFQALAELDSNHDGKLDPTDARWGELVLWADHDADRRSSQWEMLPLTSFEVVEIDLGYGVRRDCDARGNCGLERAAFVFRSEGRTQVGEVVDVRVACE